MSKWTLLMSAVILSGCATTDWHTLRIDGSDASRFEESVLRLRKELPRGQRKYFEIALAVIYIDSAITASGGDIDEDGNIDGNDVDVVLEVAIDAQRQSLMSAIEGSRDLQRIYPADDYFSSLHGLGYDEVLALAGGPSVVERYRAAYQTYWAPRQARMRELAMRNRPPPRPPRTGKPLRDHLGRTVN